MEAHPVPKNVLNVEFKLFGALSVRQFGKVLIGSLIALLLYFLPIPPLISFPLIVVSVLTGFGAALIPAFEVRVSKILGSIFVSPRYVWEKRSNVPDVLKTKPPSSGVAKGGKAAIDPNSTPTQQQLDDLSIDEILSARTVFAEQAGLETAAEDPNFTRVYDQQFGRSLEQSLENRQGANPPKARPQGNIAGQVNNSTNEKVRVSGSKTMAISPLNNNAPRDQISETAIQEVAAKQSEQQKPLGPQEIQDLREQLRKLREQLNELNKQEDNQDQRAEVLKQINDIYNQIGGKRPHDKKLPTAPGVVETHKGPTLFGVVVDKQDRPVPGAKVELIDPQQQPLGVEGLSAVDGRVGLQLPAGLSEFAVKITKQGYRFYPFKVKLTPGRTPAFKFREHR